MLYIVRHGQTDWNTVHKIQGRVDIPLNAEGERQAKALAAEFSEIRFEKAYVSPLLRAKHTAELVAPYVKTQIDLRLTERDFGDLDGKFFDDDRFVRSWYVSDQFKANWLESLESMASRVKSFFMEKALEAKNSNVLVATHGGVIMVIRYLMDNAPFDNLFNYHIKNLAVLTINGETAKKLSEQTRL